VTDPAELAFCRAALPHDAAAPLPAPPSGASSARSAAPTRAGSPEPREGGGAGGGGAGGGADGGAVAAAAPAALNAVEYFPPEEDAAGPEGQRLRAPAEPAERPCAWTLRLGAGQETPLYFRYCGVPAVLPAGAALSGRRGPASGAATSAPDAENHTQQWEECCVWFHRGATLIEALTVSVRPQPL
jgi:hypothetical protein